MIKIYIILYYKIYTYNNLAVPKTVFKKIKIVILCNIKSSIYYTKIIFYKLHNFDGTINSSNHNLALIT